MQELRRGLERIPSERLLLAEQQGRRNGVETGDYTDAPMYCIRKVTRVEDFHTGKCEVSPLPGILAYREFDPPESVRISEIRDTLTQQISPTSESERKCRLQARICGATLTQIQQELRENEATMKANKIYPNDDAAEVMRRTKKLTEATKSREQ
ncbi:hypothetical protein ACTXT7_011620 [Hymenolepis weldensis]